MSKAMKSMREHITHYEENIWDVQVAVEDTEREEDAILDARIEIFKQVTTPYTPEVTTKEEGE